MILVFNTIIDTNARQYFTNIISERITFGRGFEVLTLEDDIPDLGKFKHLLITGSELSASQGSEWDEKIISVIDSFLKANKPILGICHGHQMLARTIAGDDVCQRSAEPEFGWKKMKITNNRIFENVKQQIFLESRYDEVCNLDERFEIITSNDQLKVQAFQLKNKSVWGIQFHPEMLRNDGNNMIIKHLCTHIDDRKYFADEMENETLIESNLNIFLNFFRS